MLPVHPPFLYKIDSRDTVPDRVTATYAESLCAWRVPVHSKILNLGKTWSEDDTLILIFKGQKKNA